MDLKVGQLLASVVDSTTAIVISAPKTSASLTCGGVEMVEGKGPGGSGEIDPAHRGGAKLGKRYVDVDSGLELLCTKAGDGALAFGGKVLPEKTAKPLPASD
ncbi:hypothetical protein [Gordonia sp. KTR9]|uniref:hypothetical protein n=1 Tax=Gordonia sp. KTR9 TaxID=337191 RepID=UPI00030AEAB1|nr:hypothetical protein [Gordonia sp. KTR9]